VTRVLDEIIERRGELRSIRCDNGPKLTSCHFLAWCIERKIELVHIQPGKPTQNAHVESFHRRLREECLRVSWFQNLFDARRKIAFWRHDYNEQRPHSSLNYRTPAVTLRGRKWYGYPRIPLRDPITGKVLSKRQPIILGLRSKMTQKDAREALAREVAKRKGWFRSNGQVMNDGSVTFAWFVRNRYFPLKDDDWKVETAKTKKSLIQTNLLDDLGEIPLANFDRFTLQLHVDKLAKNCERDTVLQMRAYLRDIFEEVVDQDFLIKDPAARLKVPMQLRETDKTTLTWDQLRAALESVDAEDRVFLELDMTDALRPSELFALRWKCFDLENIFSRSTGDSLSRQAPKSRQDKEKPDKDPHLFTHGFRSAGLEDHLPGFFSRSVQFSEPGGRRARS
jgi:Integrase core domain